jgi:hypothetical protein
VWHACPTQGQAASPAQKWWNRRMFDILYCSMSVCSSSSTHYTGFRYANWLLSGSSVVPCFLLHCAAPGSATLFHGLEPSIPLPGLHSKLSLRNGNVLLLSLLSSSSSSSSYYYYCLYSKVALGGRMLNMGGKFPDELE